LLWLCWWQLVLLCHKKLPYVLLLPQNYNGICSFASSTEQKFNIDEASRIPQAQATTPATTVL
jgi:hypothetical protein